MYITEKQNFTNLVKFINQNFKKSSQKEIKSNDVQGYIRRGYLPSYMGKVKIEQCQDIKCVKLYNLVKEDEIKNNF